MATSKRGIWTTIRRIAASDRISGLIMLGFALAGLLLANLPFTAHAFEQLENFRIAIPHTNIDMGLGHWVQDGLLTVFFLTVGLELKQELTTGSLSNPKAAAVPMLCAVGGMLVPPALFIGVISLFFAAGDGRLTIASGEVFSFAQMSHGWAVPTATDIAFSLAVLALFAKALPGSIRAFLMTLATVDDLLAIILIAVFFSSVGERVVLVPRHRRMRGRLVFPGAHAQGAMARGGHRRRAGMGHDVRGRRAPHAGRRAGRPAHSRA